MKKKFQTLTSPFSAFIQVLQQIACHITLRSDQLGEILHALKDSSLDIRESLHTFLATTILSTMDCIKLCVTGLIDNLRRYPQVGQSGRGFYKMVWRLKIMRIS